MGRRAFLNSDEGYYRLKIKQNEMGWTIFPSKETIKNYKETNVIDWHISFTEGFSYKINHWYKSAGPSRNPPNKQVKRPINTENGNLSHIFPMSMLSLKTDS